MRPTLWLEVKRILGEAVDLPREEREAHVRVTARSTAVREEVFRLLSARERARRSTVRVAPGRDASAGAVGANGSAARDAAVAAGDLPRGALVAGRYLLGPRLGVGAFGAVHSATDRVSGETVAVKLVVGGGATEADLLRREISVLRRSRLPGVVELLDEGIEESWAYIVMRLVDGAPFPGDLPEDRPAWDRIEPRALALVETLGRLHWLGVLHRDVKPENVLVEADGRVTVVDLGVAHDTWGPADHLQDQLVGTPVYLAPERFLGGPATVASDLYSVGLMLYETLAGRPAREAQSLHDLYARSGEVPPPLRSVAPDVPAHVAGAIDALVHPDPGRRPPSARVLAAMLRGFGAAGARVRLPAYEGRETVGEDELRQLFAGHDRLFHIREDGAHELWRRTLGRPAEVARVIEAWIESGVARWEGGRIVIDRDGIERIETRVGSMLPRATAVPPEIAGRDADVAAVLELAGCPVPDRAVARALRRDEDDIAAAVERLADSGLARREPAGGVEALVSIDAASTWSPERRRAAHAALAASLPAASERRLYHLIAADAVGEVPAEALAVGRRQSREGLVDAALLTASNGITAARSGRAGPGVIDELLLLACDAALAESSVESLDRAAVELARVPENTPTRRTLARACAAARLVLSGSPDRAIAETEAVDAGASLGAARIRNVVRWFAARLTTDPALARRVLGEVQAWARERNDREGLAVARGLLGWRRYRQHRFASAAWLHMRCAKAHRRVREQILSLTDAASACLENRDLARAADLAALAEAAAARHRLPSHEARACWVRRSAQYRTGSPPPPDAALIAALPDGITPVVAAVGLLVEAAVLFRHDQRAEAAAAARDAARLARRANHAAAEALALALQARCTGTLDSASEERFLARTAALGVPALRMQALALFAASGREAPERIPASLRRGLRMRPLAERDPQWREVLSEVEWSEILEKVPGMPGEGGGDESTS